VRQFLGSVDQGGRIPHAIGDAEWDWQREVGRGPALPAGVNQELLGRGGFVDDTGTRQFTLMADPCIIKNKRPVSRIMSKLCLPRGTRVLTDDHYRCPRCLRENPTRKQEERDWNF
jgi:hypothetical protein